MCSSRELTVTLSTVFVFGHEIIKRTVSTKVFPMVLLFYFFCFDRVAVGFNSPAWCALMASIYRILTGYRPT